ncbi:MAG TPA: transposase family protein, partial [Ktedonobacteraceae bacterium]
KLLLEKDDLKKMEVKQLLSLPKGLEVTNIEVTDGVLIISAVSTQKSACCPLCSSLGTRVHGHYSRTVADLPCAGQQVRRLLQVRKFFCDVSTCARKIFAERLAPFIEPWARVTARLYQIVQAIGLATGGMLGTRLTDRLGIQTCWMTIIRRIMALATAPVEQVSELGIDDFSRARVGGNSAPSWWTCKATKSLTFCLIGISRNGQSLDESAPRNQNRQSGSRGRVCCRSTGRGPTSDPNC